MKNLNKTALLLAVSLTALLAAVFITGCSSDSKDKAETLIKIVEACEPGNTVTMAGHVGTWGGGLEVSCTWTKKEK